MIRNRLRFGAFEADLETREIYRNGVRLRLQSKPFQILELLLSAEGGVVTRDTFYRALWPGIHVERSRCLNTAIRKLRAALGPEDPDRPVIETLGSLGYRLAVSLDPVPGTLRQAPLFRPGVLPLDDRVGGPHADRSIATSSPTYQKYLQALHHFSRATEKDFGQAIELLQDVIAENGRFAPAYTALALIYSYTIQFGPQPPDQAYPRIESLIARALALDPESPDALAVLGMTRLLYSADCQAAETAFRRAIKLDPSLARAHLGFSQVCTVEGRHAEAIEALERALALQPAAPELGVMMACAHYFAGDHPAALGWIERTLAGHPGFPLALTTAGWIHTALGMHEEAVQTLREAEAAVPGGPLFRLHLAHGLAAAGQTDEAKTILQEMTQARRSGWVSPYLLTLVHLALKQPGPAFRWFQQAVRERDGWRVLSGVDPRLAPLTGHPEFRALLNEAGLPHPVPIL